ncbi:predicted protein [Chaetomium globosum CBS 148.51]|uniref:Uncharacterized protein n=1 Tax=Chaetomium globosum (strain ATCC 6205 / CBS 148.51 / DSM 1962 / NBRC 6347 / NRRL 1970) TaxID=306901 RepID=Q2GY72_CHAGB|nr:uncharacterized protein CHGG_07082 [Chaetomium globosum CBS 148.51]EAQ85829.1 predicted protein [Chaetomium globosum CBS 148.51]
MFDSLKPESCESHATSRSPSLEAAILIGRHFFGCYQRTFPAFKNPTCGYPRLPWAMKTAHRPRDMDAQKPCQVSSRTYCNTLFPFPALGSQAEHTSSWLWVQTWSPTNAGHTGERIRLKAIPSERRSSTDWDNVVMCLSTRIPIDRSQIRAINLESFAPKLPPHNPRRSPGSTS